MKKKILLPTDFSENAWNAICYAIELYKNQECEFYILNAYNAVGYVGDNLVSTELNKRVYEEVKEKSEKGLTKVLEQLSFKEDAPNHKFYMVSQYNTLLEAVKDIVEKKDITMIKWVPREILMELQ